MKRLARFLGVLVVISISTSAMAADKKVERLWKAKCSSCHGMDGKGQTEKGKKMKIQDMTSAEFQKATDADITKAITEGVSKETDGVKQEMDAYKEELKEAEITSLVAFIRELGGKK